MGTTRGASKPAGSNSKTLSKRPGAAKKPGAAGSKNKKQDLATPAPKQKRKFVKKTHTTAGVAQTGKKKDPKKKREADLARLEKQLPKLNMITPAGVVLPKGKKKGKVFVEDKDKMMSILLRVNDSKDGQIQSKLERSRKLEEIREARRKDEEARNEQRKSKMESAKDVIRNKRKRKSDEDGDKVKSAAKAYIQKKSGAKKVAFA